MIVFLDVSEMYGNYVFSPFSSEESFYRYVEESKKEFKEEIEEEGTYISLFYPCIRKISQIDDEKTIIFCEEGWEKMDEINNSIDLADYCGMLTKDEKGFWKC